MVDTAFQVVILAGGECKRLYPLTSAGIYKALLPVGNRPLISYPLRNLAEAGIKSAIVVAIGEAVSGSLAGYLTAQQAAGGVACQLITVPEECGTADALRLVAGRVTAETLVVYSGDILTDLPLSAVVVTHQVTGALATVLLGKRKTSPTSETKPGKPPRGVDYLGIDPGKRLLLFAASSPESLRDIKLPLAAVQQGGALQLHSDLCDQHLYVLSRPALKLLTSRTSLSSLKLDFIPWLTRHQLKHPPPGPSSGPAGRSSFLLSRSLSGSFASTASLPGPATAAPGLASSQAAAAVGPAAASGRPGAAGMSAATPAPVASAGLAGGPGAAADDATDGEGSVFGGPPAGSLGAVGDGYMQLSHSGAPSTSSRAGRVGVYLVPDGAYCARVNTVQAYGEVNRDVAAADIALHLAGLSVSKYDNCVPPSVSLGTKATIGPACIVGEGCKLGDKCSVKRCVVGANCSLGANVKVINCVLMDGITIADGAHIQNCVICSGAVVQERASLKDCQVGPGFVVAAASEHKSETLARM